MAKARFAPALGRWDILEVVLEGPSAGNPFLDVTVSATFSHGHRALAVDGFYDGAGVYKVRFMPDTIGSWRFATHSNVAHLDGGTGEFECLAPSATNHGPVTVCDRHHFAYADGSPHYSVGTTCYAWIHQGEALERQTLSALAVAPFDKLRMCIFPKDYVYNRNEPEYYPFERSEAGDWDLNRFSPRFFHHLETRL